MADQREVYRRVAAHPDYTRLRIEADKAYANAGSAATYEEMVGAQVVMAQACAAVTEIYDTVIAEITAEETPWPPQPTL